VTTFPFDLPHPRGNGSVSVCVPVPDEYTDEYPNPNCQYVEYYDYGPLDPGTGTPITEGDSAMPNFGRGGFKVIFSFNLLYQFFLAELGGIGHWLRAPVARLLQVLYYVLVFLTLYFLPKIFTAPAKDNKSVAGAFNFVLIVGGALATLGILFTIKPLTFTPLIIFGIALVFLGLKTIALQFQATEQKKDGELF
jgi:hypothetical protein